MIKVDVMYLMEREYGDGITAQAEDCITLTLKNSIIEQLKITGEDGEKSKVFRTLEKMLQSLAKLKGYEFIKVELISEVGVYRDDG